MSARDRAHLALALAVVAGALAVLARTRRSISGQDGPRPAVEARAARSEGEPGADLGVAVRLIDELRGATFESPRLAEGRAVLARHWRRTKAPYVGPAGALGAVVQQVALTTSTDETPMRVELSDGRVWAPDAQTWNMAEGSYAQREVLLAPPPTTIRWHLVVPARARFEAEVALAPVSSAGAAFELAVIDDAGRHVVAHETRAARDGRGFSPWRADLGAFAQRAVTLELRTLPTAPGLEPAAALVAAPVVLAPGAATFPFNVLFVVIDALRPDALASLHDEARDARMAAAAPPPLDAWLPRMPTVAPRLDALAAEGVAFTRAYSAASWTRPGTVAMLSGMRSSELGLETTSWILPEPDVRRLYASRPPFLPLLLREHGVTTAAIVNNYFLVGHARAGLDVGFEGVDDHRYATRDTRAIVEGATAWLRAHASQRFALFVNFNAPHGPYQPPDADLAAVPAPPLGPTHELVRRYLGEVHKDDAAVGRLLDELDRLRLADRTLVVVTADHGETLSSAHDDRVPGIDDHALRQRFHHASSMWEETTRVPIVLRLPGALPAGTRVDAPVQTTDLVPTLLDLAHLTGDARMSGRTLLPLVRGEPRAEAAVVIEGRGARSVQLGRWRWIERDPAARHLVGHHGEEERRDELYDLEADPGERRRVAARDPAVVAPLREALALAMARGRTDEAQRSDALAGSTRAATTVSPEPCRVHLRFAGGGAARRVTGSLSIRTSPGARLRATPVGIPDDALRVLPGGVELALTTSASLAVGVDVEVTPATADLAWELWLDDAPWPAGRTYGGPLALASPALATGIATHDARAAATGPGFAATIDARRELGLFVLRDPVGDELDTGRGESSEADHEIADMFRAWGYAKSAAPR